MVKIWVKATMVAVLSCGCFAATPVMRFGGGASEEESRHAELVRMAPGQLDVSTRWDGPIRTGKVRVWADDEYRAQNIDWQHAVERELDDMNRVTAPMFGLRLTPEFHSWDRHAPGSRLDDALDDLKQLDTGEDVVAVIGLISALALASATYEELGIASLGEPYVVMRGYAAIEEHQQLQAELRSYDDATRERMIAARHAHKTTTVMLHELAHSLGAIHERDRDDVMSAIYSHEATSLSARNRELVLITLADRLEPAAHRDRRATYEKLAAALEPAWPTAVGDERANMLDRLHRAVGTRATAAAAIETTTPDVRRNQALRLVDAGDLKAARAMIAKDLQGTVARDTALVACKIDLADGKAASTMCERAAEPPPGERDPRRIVDAAADVVHAMINARAAGAAVHILAQTEARLAGDRTPAVWLALAQQYRDLDAVDEAEHATSVGALAPGSDDRLSNWIALTRARYGIPQGTHADFDAVAAIRGAIAQISSGRVDDAIAAITTAEATWPALPGLVAARCDLERHRGHVQAARELCAKAGGAGSSWALYVAGQIELEAGTAQKAAGPLKRAVAIDPELSLAWVSLAKALAKAGAGGELQSLRRDYRAHFHRALPE